MRHFALALLACLAGAGACRADTSLFGDFTVLNGAANASGGHVIFTLNGDGTIAASMVSYGDSILGFGFNSAAINLPESNFAPTAPDNTQGWSDTYGYQASGFSCSVCGLSETWTIGNPGDYTSVFQVLDGGNNSAYDFYFLGESGDWAADAVAESPVPEPSSWMLLGAGVLGLALRQRRRRG